MDYYNYNFEIHDLDLKEASRVHGQCFSSDSDSEDGKEELDEIYFQNRLTLDLDDSMTQIIKAKSYSAVLKSSLQNDNENNQVSSSSVKKIDNTNVSKGTETVEAVTKKSKRRGKKNKKKQVFSVENKTLISPKQNQLSNVDEIQLHTSDALENAPKPASLLLQALTGKTDALLTEKVQTPTVQTLHTNVVSQFKETSSERNIQNGKSPFYNENSAENMSRNSTVSDLVVNTKNGDTVNKSEVIEADGTIQTKKKRNRKKRPKKTLEKQLMTEAKNNDSATNFVETQARTESDGLECCKSLESIKMIFSRVIRKFTGSSLSFEQSFGKLYDQHGIFAFTECIHFFVLKDFGRMKCLKMYLTHPKCDRISCAVRERFFVRFISDVLDIEDLELKTNILRMEVHDKKLTFIDNDGKMIKRSVEIVNPTPNIPLMKKGKALYIDTCTLKCSDMNSEQNQVAVCHTNKSLSSTAQNNVSVPENTDTSQININSNNNNTNHEYSDSGPSDAGSSLKAREKGMQKRKENDVEELQKINMKLNQPVYMPPLWQTSWIPLYPYLHINQSQILPSKVTTYIPGINQYVVNNISYPMSIHHLNFMSQQRMESHRRPVFVPTSLIRSNQINNTVCAVPQGSRVGLDPRNTLSRNEIAVSADEPNFVAEGIELFDSQRAISKEDVVLLDKTKSTTERIQKIEPEPGTSRQNKFNQDTNTLSSEAEIARSVDSVEFKPTVSLEHTEFQDCESDQHSECSINDSPFSLTESNYISAQNSSLSETCPSQLSENLEDNIQVQCPVCKVFFIHNRDKGLELDLDGKNCSNQTLPGKSNQNCDIRNEDWNSIFIYINFYLVVLGCLYAVLQLVTCIR